MLINLLTNVFEILVLFSSIMIVSSRNPVHAVLFLVLLFCNASGLLLLCGAEFVAMVMVVVYVGAIAVLFLFVVMMLDIRFLEAKREFLLFFPVGFLVLFTFSTLFFSSIYAGFGSSIFFDADFPLFYYLSRTDNIFVFANLLYTYFFLFFLFSGLILLVAMVGAILLTFSPYSKSKKQLYFSQISRVSDFRYAL